LTSPHNCDGLCDTSFDQAVLMVATVCKCWPDMMVLDPPIRLPGDALRFLPAAWPKLQVLKTFVVPYFNSEDVAHLLRCLADLKELELCSCLPTLSETLTWLD